MKAVYENLQMQTAAARVVYRQARDAYRQVKKRKREVEHELYGVLGRCFGVLPLEVIYIIMDELLLAEWRDFLRREGCTNPTTVFSFFATCTELHSIRNGWCKHAYRMLGGQESLDDLEAWGWMKDSFTLLVSRTCSIEGIRTLALGIVLGEGRLRELLPLTWKTEHERDINEYHTRNINFANLPNTVKYVCARSPHRVTLYLMSGLWRDLDTPEWLAMLRALHKGIMVHMLLAYDCYDTLQMLCAADKTVWAQAVLDLLFPPWGFQNYDETVLISLLKVYQNGWFTCWEDIWSHNVRDREMMSAWDTFNRRLTIKAGRSFVPALLSHAPQELLDMPESMDGRPSKLVCRNISEFMKLDGWDRLKLSGEYEPKYPTPLICDRIKRCGGVVLVSWIIQVADTCEDALPMLQTLDAGSHDYLDYSHLSDVSQMDGPRVKVLKVLWQLCSGWPRERLMLVWSRFLNLLHSTKPRDAPMRRFVLEKLRSVKRN